MKINTTTTIPSGSPGMQELSTLYKTLHKPYGNSEINRFNFAYRRLYPKFNTSEMRQAELLVDALLDDLENENLAAKIYGVV